MSFGLPKFNENLASVGLEKRQIHLLRLVRQRFFCLEIYVLTKFFRLRPKRGNIFLFVLSISGLRLCLTSHFN